MCRCAGIADFPLSGKVFAALVSSSLENVPSGVGSHALSESVNLASLSFLGLVSPFHFILLESSAELSLRISFFSVAKNLLPSAKDFS